MYGTGLARSTHTGAPLPAGSHRPTRRRGQLEETSTVPAVAARTVSAGKAKSCPGI